MQYDVVFNPDASGGNKYSARYLHDVGGKYVVCKYCDKRGHFEYNCGARKRDFKAKSNQNTLGPTATPTPGKVTGVVFKCLFPSIHLHHLLSIYVDLKLHFILLLGQGTTKKV